MDGRRVACVLLDSVQSQANRIEEALLAAAERGQIELPIISVEFGDVAPYARTVTTLDAPHRIADAIFRDSLYEGKRFRETDLGKAFAEASYRDATRLFEYCPTALIFGFWDSTGPLGGLGAKFSRALVSEIVGYDAVQGRRTQSRIDPLRIARQAAVLYEGQDGTWTLSEEKAKRDKQDNPKKYGETGRPSEAVHGNITPSIEEDGGFTIAYALQTATLSLPALRRLRFPTEGRETEDRNLAARTVLAALGIAGILLLRREGYDLRSRCLLLPEGPTTLELLPVGGGAPRHFAADPDSALPVFREALKKAKSAGLPWHAERIRLEPMDKLKELIRRSIEIFKLGVPEEEHPSRG